MSAPPPPDDLHEWISFEDPDEHRTWVFDATYLRSNYMCIYGCGCKGILDEPAPELQQGCCSYGAHFVDADDLKNVEAHAERVRPEHMQFFSKMAKKGFTKQGDLDSDGEPTIATRLVDDACIFLNRPGFDGGVGCALHIAAVDAGERPLDWKPQVCWQVPLRLEHSEDESGHVTSRLREWKRRDWGEGGDDFGWWCTEEPDAFIGKEPLYISAKDDIIELVGAGIYATMAAQLARTEWVPLPHPAVKSTVGRSHVADAEGTRRAT
ncbi:hypothetical protein [Ilumatobacter coccineus]|uniref:DUF3109 family protein n=1 Tax=Ilumatobacter coccineus (strain NBRC 103263 / KCTC 29153 / YM16-304) TaxID=1313172 RepID=A0A6C7E8I8_ILUCY|nr:hypothetical protein [Ilumatobacter coccineus]BAN02342.1 hypothetical protein YM304_20280 [Ilumatobacter coccineus YM16-304]